MSSGEGSGQQGQNTGGVPQQGGGGDMAGGQQSQGGNQQGQNVNQQHQQQQQQQQQLQLQQSSTAQNAQNANQMQQLQVIQQPLQNQYLQQLYNTQGQLLMPGNIALHHQLNPQIQVITAGKSFQPNQLGSPHMLTSGYATIPTSAANNQQQAYIIGQLINSSQPSILQQHSQPGKPGEMQKVIQPQITQTQLPQGLTWAAPHTYLPSPIFIRNGTQPDQMYIQQQQPLHSSAGSHQQFTMPLTATGQLSTSISSASANGLQQVTQQQQNQNQGNQANQGQQQQNQSQNQQQIQSGNVLSMKTQANLQPKPPLQIQPSPTNQQQVQQHQQQLQQQQMNVTMGVGGQFHMIPQPTSQANVLSQQILAQNSQTITTQVMHPNQPQQLQQQRQLTILPQQPAGQSLPQQVTFIQQPQQHQPIRPNYTVTAATPAQPTSQSQGVTTTPVPQQRPKIRKPGPNRGTANNNNVGSPTQQSKVMYQRPPMPTAVAPAPIQSKLAPANQAPSGATLTRISSPGTQSQQQQPVPHPLKTINISALHTPPTLPDATLTPLIPQSNAQITATSIQQPPQALQVFPTTTQLPTPNISITPTAPPQKKDEPIAETPVETKGEPEKENTKLSNSSQSNHDVDESKSKLPKAMVKPQVLTHVIEGFVIQEASEPFPMSRNGDSDEPPKKKVALSPEMGKCEMCGKVDVKTKFKKNKRFCTSACAKNMKAQQNHQYQQQQQQSVNAAINLHASEANKSKSKSRKWGEGGDAESTDETSSSMGDASVMSPATTEHIEEEPKMNPVKWNVAEVVDFVRSLPGCSEYADDFAVQEIDGQALMLLKEDHLMSAIGMKLGPALKLCAKIEALRSTNNNSNSEQNSGKA